MQKTTPDLNTILLGSKISTRSNNQAKCPQTIPSQQKQPPLCPNFLQLQFFFFSRHLHPSHNNRQIERKKMSRIVTKITALARPSPPFSCSYHQPFSFDFREKPLPLVPFRRGAGVVERAALEMRCALAGTEGSNPSLSAYQDTDPQDNEFCGFLVSRPVGSRKVSARDWIRETQLRRSGSVDCLY